jgi:uncharacterized protein
VRPLDDDEIDRLQALLDALPAPLEPLDASMLDGYLCGVLVQPGRVPLSRWWPHVLDVEGRPLPPGHDVDELRRLALRRHAELDAAIERRDWFDPWVFGPEDDDEAAPAAQRSRSDDGHAGGSVPQDDADDAGDDGPPPEVQAVYPWVAGCVTALDLFPALMVREGPALNDALVLLYRHLDPDDLEDADAILEAIDALEPPENLAVAVEELVRATLLLADIGRPRQAAHDPSPGPRRRGPLRR